MSPTGRRLEQSTGRRRVLQVFQPQDGGVPEHVSRLAPALQERGWEVEVAGPQSAPAIASLRASGVPFHPLPSTRGPGARDVTSLWRLRKVLQAGHFAVIHAHSSKAGALVRLLSNTPAVVYTPHCFSFAAQFPPHQRALFRFVEQALVPRTDALVASSEWESKEASRHLRGVRRRLRVVHYGVAEPDDSRPCAKLLDFADGKPIAGMVSVLRQQKDPLALVRAAELIQKNGRFKGKLAIVGNGDLARTVVSEIETRGLQELVRWFEFQQPASQYLKALDVFVLPSLWESLPIAVLEALGHGLPVIATNVCGTPEAVVAGKTGLLVEPHDPQGLARALETMLNDGALRARLGAEAERMATARFSIGRMAREISATYEDVLASRDYPFSRTLT